MPVDPKTGKEYPYTDEGIAQHKKDTGGMPMKSSGFKMRSGNTTPFKQMGSSPGKQITEEEHQKQVVDDYVPVPYSRKHSEGKSGDSEKEPKTESPKSQPATPPKEPVPEPGNGTTTPTSTDVTPPKKKRGWFGFKDMGITEALDAMTRKQNE